MGSVQRAVTGAQPSRSERAGPLVARLGLAALNVALLSRELILEHVPALGGVNVLVSLTH